MSGGPADLTTITFLGASAAVPEPGRDTASFLINRSILVDTGWHSVDRMQLYGFSPLELEYLILTHCHHDHYLGLPHILFYRSMKRRERPDMPLLKVIGPEADVERVVRLSMGLLQPKRFEGVCERPESIPILPSAAFEADEFRLETCPSVHPVQGFCFRLTDKKTGAEFGYTGDTSPDTRFIDFFRGVPLLIHEASFGPESAPVDNPSGHSGAPDAAQLAAAAGVGRLALVHCPEKDQAAALEAARVIFPQTFWPEDGERIDVGGRQG